MQGAKWQSRIYLMKHFLKVINRLGKMIEPIPDEEILKKYPSHADLRHKPDFMLIRGRKNV